MKTKEEIKSLGNQWALDNADETMETNSALNRGYVGGYNQCQEDNLEESKKFGLWLGKHLKLGPILIDHLFIEFKNEIHNKI